MYMFMGEVAAYASLFSMNIFEHPDYSASNGKNNGHTETYTDIHLDYRTDVQSNL